MAVDTGCGPDRAILARGTGGRRLLFCPFLADLWPRSCYPKKQCSYEWPLGSLCTLSCDYALTAVNAGVPWVIYIPASSGSRDRRPDCEEKQETVGASCGSKLHS